MHDSAITNFGGNVAFTPRVYYKPESEAEVLEILRRHARGKIRVVGSRHAWSEAILSDDVLVDLRRLKRVCVELDNDGTTWVTAGGGCKIKRLLRILHAHSNATLPSLGLIDEQTIAGAISTGTHGSGTHSMSHAIDEVRVAAYDADTGKAHVFVYDDGPELRAARCALGCMGIILSVRIRCIPKYDVAEVTMPCATIDEALAGERDHPLQQFYLMPHRWSYYAQRRTAAPPSPRQSWSARLFRAYWFFNIDLGLHWVVKALASGLLKPAAIRFFFRHALAFLVLQKVTVVDTSHHMLLMEHELFKHLEIEVFVPMSELRAAAEFVCAVLAHVDGASGALRESISRKLQSIHMESDLQKLHGTYTHHYPICIRRVLPDDTLISMTAGAESYYAISFITYAEPRDAFFAVARFLARSMTLLFRARLHWGKYFPLEHSDVAAAFPRLAEFRRLCERMDPQGVFRNAFVDRVLGFSASER